MDTAPSYTIAGIAPHHELVEAWSTARLPFEPKGWLRDFRDGLAQAVRGLGPSAGQTLHAEYISESRDLCDAENVLFCNVGSGCFAAAASDGLRFERAYNPIPPSPSGIHAAHYYRYRMSPPRADFAHWRRGRTQARWDGAVFDSLGELRLPALVWARIAESSIELDGEMSDGQAFGLSVTVRHPEGRGLNLTNLVKTVFDGAIASFHAHSGPIADQVRAS